MPFDFFLPLLLALPPAAALQPVDPAHWPGPLLEVAAALQSRGPFQIPYRQERFVAGLKRPLLSHGVFHRDADSAIRFEQQSPFPRSLRISGSGISETQPGGPDRRVHAPFVQAATAPLLALFSGDLSRAARNFDARWSGGVPGWVLELSPKGTAAGIFSSLRAEGDSGIRRVEVREGRDGLTRLHFGAAFPDSPPEGR